MSSSSDQIPNGNNTNSLDLAAALEALIESKHLYLKNTMPDDFAFTIHDEDDGCDLGVFDSPFNGLRGGDICLTREFDGEKIEVYVAMPNFSERGRSSYCGGGGRGRGGFCGKRSGADTLTLVVEITKKYGGKSSFHVHAAASNVRVESMGVMVPSDDDEGSYSPGATMYTVDKKSNLQRCLREYLRSRGIEKSSVEFLYNYMLRKSKSKKQPVVVLKKVLKVLKD